MKHQWGPYMSEIYRVLKPGTGWIQSIEFQGHRFFSESPQGVPEDSPLREVIYFPFPALILRETNV
jgi:hypothetical protein